MEGLIAQQYFNQDRLTLLTFQNQLYSLVCLRFFILHTFYWWTFDFANLTGDALLAQWVTSFEEVYGELLSQPPIQKMLGDNMNFAIREWQIGISGM